MKKMLLIITIILVYVGFGYVAEKKNIIPKEAIRIRILANSNSNYDQKQKIIVKEELEKYLYDLMSNAENIEQADIAIRNNMNSLKNLVSSIFDGEFKINYGMNYFPSKEYKGITYDEGYYKSLVVSLGNGLGDNWWCILFPPLCMLDGTELDEIEYRSIVKDIVDKYF